MRSDEGQTAQRLRVVILGGGTAGWMVASGLSRLLPAGEYDLTLVESEEIGTVGVGEATLPHIKQFNDRLGIDEAEFMRATGATIKLGIEFVGWNQPDDRYIHPFGAFGEPWAGVDFQHHWARARLAGIDAGSLQDYSFAVALCRAGGFDHPVTDAGSIRSSYSYAYHFDAGLYAEFLRGWAVARGVKRVEGRIIDVTRDGESGHVTRLTLAAGNGIDGDFFIDCSGFRSLLVGGAMQVPWCDWSHWLPCDRALAVPSGRVEPLTPYTRATARKAGWIWRIPLQHRTGNGYVFSSRWCGEDEARDTLLGALDGPVLGEPRLLRFAAGRRARAWEGNCLAVGLSSGFLEPLESTSIFLIQAALFDLVGLMPRAGGGIDPRLAAEFNRLFEIHYDRVRDFLVLHYRANSRQSQPLWDHVRTMALPDSLLHKLALFREGAAAPDYKLGLFSRDSWLSVFEGQGVMPEGYARLADRLPLPDLQARLSALRGRIRDGLTAMPAHADFIARHCMAPDHAGSRGNAA